MKALSVRQPWAWMIIYGGKNIENRSWNTGYRGPLLIHASKTVERDAHEYLLIHGHELPALNQLQTGGIVGMAELLAVHQPGDMCANAWHEQDQYGFHLVKRQALPFRAYKGSLGLFEVEYSLETIA